MSSGIKVPVDYENVCTFLLFNSFKLCIYPFETHNLVFRIKMSSTKKSFWLLSVSLSMQQSEPPVRDLHFGCSLFLTFSFFSRWRHLRRGAGYLAAALIHWYGPGRR